MNLNQDF